nr:DUF1302 family protein [Marinobacter sp. NP-4(2019)]
MTTKRLFVRQPLGSAILACSLVAVPLSSQAARFQFGELQGSFDSTISVGAGWRASDIDEELVAPVTSRAARPNRAPMTTAT